MNTRLNILLMTFGLFANAQADAQPAPRSIESKTLNFSRLPNDDEVCRWLKATSPHFADAYDAILKRSYVNGIEFKSIPQKKDAYSKLGVFFDKGLFEIRLSDKLAGAERVRTLAMEVANTYLNEEHRQIDIGAKNGFFNAREYAIAHEIYEYEAWRLYHQFLFDIEKELGEGRLPTELFYGTATRRVKDYKLPPLYAHLKHMEDSKHMQHYLDWFEKHYAKRNLKNVAEPIADRNKKGVKYRYCLAITHGCIKTKAEGSKE